ncbi:hypothetical protein P3T30_002417 [Kitasatospora sp. MAP12-9]
MGLLSDAPFSRRKQTLLRVPAVQLFAVGG